MFRFRSASGRAPRKSQVTDTYGDACGLRRDGRAAHAPWAPDEGCKEPSYRTDGADDESTRLDTSKVTTRRSFEDDHGPFDSSTDNGASRYTS
ncbi:hypothetical protein SBD_4032 [Streptomyces bottropensis ATCC 25435]|uniref:Uncharacterized protein n=1 Tax=Streptomyces bottropensis ATCC 25435 TaxID=1054862 RepID=M3FQF2_9ACTN|nr:hypothetical protein SBD_4032 [Streptomyces bottropensis ATCC 25435]